MTELNYLLLISLWAVYFVIHSVLASFRCKEALTQLPILANSYRLVYNILSVLLLLPLVYMMYAIPSPIIWHWSGALKIVANLLAFSALLGFILSLRYYNNMDFLGISQLRQAAVSATKTKTNQFTLSPLHQYVRHPWYFFALILIWTRDMNAHFLISACCMTAYFIIGTIYEERKLVVEFGKVYSDYQKAVPALIPSFRRFLTRKQAKDLLNSH